MIERVDLAFSRDQQERIYVQHRLHAATSEVRAWVDRGAAIYVRGSLEGMAPAVEATLVDILGTAALQRMIGEGLCRRDVY